MIVVSACEVVIAIDEVPEDGDAVELVTVDGCG